MIRMMCDVYFIDLLIDEGDNDAKDDQSDEDALEDQDHCSYNSMIRTIGTDTEGVGKGLGYMFPNPYNVSNVHNLYMDYRYMDYEQDHGFHSCDQR